MQEFLRLLEHMVLRIQGAHDHRARGGDKPPQDGAEGAPGPDKPPFPLQHPDSIAWMCEQGRNADAVNMVHALARLFRISISRGHELIPIAKEIEHAESYPRSRCTCHKKPVHLRL